MSNAALITIAWLAVALHVIVGTVVLRRTSSVSLLALLNLAVALCVLAYWAQKWYSYLTRGVTWYVSDQGIPLFALVVAIISLLTLTGRLSASWPPWLIFSIQAILLLAGALFFTFFRINRLI